MKTIDAIRPRADLPANESEEKRHRLFCDFVDRHIRKFRGSETRLYLVLLRLAEQGEVCASVAYLARCMSAQPRTVKASMKPLIKHGLIERQISPAGSPYGTNRYRLIGYEDPKPRAETLVRSKFARVAVIEEPKELQSAFDPKMLEVEV